MTDRYVRENATNPAEQVREFIRTGQLPRALERLRSVCDAGCADAGLWFLRGAVCGQAGFMDEAIGACRQAIALDPGHVDAHFNLAQAHMHRGEYAEAVEAYRVVAEARPQDAGILSNSGYALVRCGRYAEAVACLRRARSLRPGDSDVLINLANALRGLGERDEAESLYREVLQRSPGNAAAWFNLGTLLVEDRKLEAAADALRRAVEIHPAYTAARIALARVLLREERTDEALEHARRAVQLDQDSVEALCILGAALRKDRKLNEAIQIIRSALRRDPASPEVSRALAAALFEQGDATEAEAIYRRILAGDPHNGVRTNLLFLLLHVYDDGDLFLREHLEWVRQNIPAVSETVPHDNAVDPERVLRVGYVSADFREHPVAYFIEGILANHDPASVHCVGISSVARPDTVTERFRKLAHAWHDVASATDEELAALIRRERIDVLVDLSGHTAGHRLAVFARRPAPVQITYLGYAGTTGMTQIGYRLTDEIADPAGNASFYTEHLVRLPRAFFCYRPADGAPEVLPPPAVAHGYVTYGSFNKLQKITDDVIALWAHVLRAVRGSKLFVFRTELRGEVRDRLAARFARAGIGGERLILGLGESMPRHWMSLYEQVDIALDTFPWTGHTTTCEALWMGVPVVTLCGKTHAARMVASTLHYAGLPELVARSPDEYVSIARDLAGDVEELRVLRRSMRARLAASPLLDANGFTRDLENAYRGLWREWCGSQRGQ